MLWVDFFLCLLLLGLTGYLMYSSYTFRSSATDEATKNAIKEHMFMQVGQMFLTFGLLYAAYNNEKVATTI